MQSIIFGVGRRPSIPGRNELENDVVDSADVGCMTPMRLPDKIPLLFQAPQDLPESNHLERILVHISRAVEACAVFAGSSGPTQLARRYLGVGIGVRYWFTQRRIQSEYPEPLNWQVLDRFCEFAHTELKACKIGVIADICNVAWLEHSWERPELVYQNFEYVF
jgi:hypothetical protein